VSQVQLAVSGSQSDVTAVSRVTVTDPAGEVRSVGFYVTGRNRRRIGPSSASRILAGGVYEKDIVLDASELTRVQAEIVLVDGSVLTSQNTTFGTRFEPISLPSGILTSVAVTPAPSRLDISATRGSAFKWKCFCKKGGQPTIAQNGAAATSTDPLDEAFLRFNESEVVSTDPSLSFSMAADPGPWNLIALGYNSAGQQGPRRTATVQVTA
jgi:hypothetical protein